MLIAFNWEEWGWAIGRLDSSTRVDAYSALYENKWKEDHTLLTSSYGVGSEKGSWVLLQPTRPGSPILDYSNGKYVKMRNGKQVSFRPDELIHHSGTELKAAREIAKEKVVAATHDAVEQELSTDGFEVGDKVFVQAIGPDGSESAFQAVILAIRKKYPPIKVMYIKTYPGGESDPLLLPSPTTAHVPVIKISANAP